jgi:hypothetical protein
MSTPQPALRSWKLTASVLALAVLPLLLVALFALIGFIWIAPITEAQMSQCSAVCPAVTYWERLELLLTLGPAFLVALIYIFAGSIGLLRARTRPILLSKRALLRRCLWWGLNWAFFFVCFYVGIFWLQAIHP